MSEVNATTTVVTSGLTLVSNDDDPAPDPAAVHVMDGVTMVAKTELPWPMQETESATLSIWAPDAAYLASVVKGRGISIDYMTPRGAGTTRVRFDGRITDAVLRTRSDGVAMDITAMDYRSTDLNGEVGDAPWPEESVVARVARIFTLLGLDYDHTQDLPLAGGGVADLGTVAPGSAPLVKARDVDNQPALALLTSLLDGWAVDWSSELETLGNTVPPGAGMGRFVLRPVVDGFGEVVWWETVPRLAALIPNSAYVMAGDFGLAGDGYGVTVPTANPDRAPGLAPASVVDLAAAYTQRPGQRSNRVTVSWWNAGAEVTTSASTGQTPVTRLPIATELTQLAAAQRAAALYLPDAGSSDWYADDFTWRWYADTDAHDQPMPAIGDPFTIAPIQDRHTPTGRPWYSGILTGRVVQLVNARPVVDLTISPELRPLLGTPASGLAWNDVPAGVTWDDLNTRDTWDDYRLLRS